MLRLSRIDPNRLNSRIAGKLLRQPRNTAPSWRMGEPTLCWQGGRHSETPLEAVPYIRHMGATRKRPALYA